MKNKLLAVLCAVLLISIAGCASTPQSEDTASASQSVQTSNSIQSSSTSQEDPSQNPGQAHTISDVQQQQIYASLLEKYTDELMGNAQDWGEDPIDYFLHQHNPLQVGYTYMDINQDGIDELIIGSNETGEYGTFLALYTISDDDAILVTQYMDPYIPNLCSNGTISTECFMPGDQASYSFSKLGPDGLIDLDMICFNIADGSWVRVSGDDYIDISEAEAEDILSIYPYEALHFTPFLTDSNSNSNNFDFGSDSYGSLPLSAITEALAEWVPPYIAVADDFEAHFEDETQTTAFVQVKLKAAHKDAFTIDGFINMLMSCSNDGIWFAETYENQCDIVYNYAGEYYDDSQCLVGYVVDSSVQLGSGVATLTVVPLDFTHGGSDPTGETLSCYLDRYSGSLKNAAFSLETWDKSIQIPLDSQMKPLMYQQS